MLASGFYGCVIRGMNTDEICSVGSLQVTRQEAIAGAVLGVLIYFNFARFVLKL
ncbi:hypothetical protein [Nostoc sp. PA-18-2419]|uniref:hypothetical protein n=1 Tax=Nostoc sp. PA-18-2419 TaxID=2575443 RepID=UPI001679B88B|nr:hypothetical protein [Nostoc sp. PA-18-2419]